MTESNKILTVSYGTFSCTLEGFDDPFGTMRGIAEYFRDLAAEDRYFGAEPPTPDVEMLQNIAQRDVQRRVDARIGESGVALRQTEAVEDAELSEPAPAAEAPAPAPKEAEAPPAEVGVPDTAPLAFDDEYLMADEPEDAFVVDTKATVDTAPAPESIAEKLRRIRAVVSRNIEPAPEETNLFSDADPDEGSAFAAPKQKRERALSETIRSITADIGDDDDGDDDFDALNPADPDPRAEAEDDAELDAEDEATPLYEEDEFIDTHAEDTGSEALFADPSDETIGFEDDAMPEVAEDDSQDTILAGVLAATARADSDRDETEPFEDAATDPDEQRGASAEVETEGAPTDEAPVDEVSADADEPPVDEAEDGDDKASERTAKLEPLSDANGAVGRLLKETDEKFAEDDGIRRRRVISQMRAAVAATKAERSLSKPVSPDQVAREEQSPYRRDLDKVMPGDMSANSGDAPKTPAAATARQTEITRTSAEGDKPRAAPLVLVSSQRVDEDVASLATPSTPPRHEVGEAETFAAFAEEMGAEELPDLLEAAAAFSAFVEGQPHFSRPDIMKRVARVDPALSLSREAGLRSFGMLLRQGKIRKLQRGQFTISDDTRFNPAHRIAGQ